MGACCVADRKMSNQENSSTQLEQPINLFTNEDDPDGIADICIIDNIALQRDMKKIIQITLKQARKNTSDTAIPFFIASIDLSSSKVAILFRSYELLKTVFDYCAIDKEGITDDWVLKKFVSSSVDQTQFLINLKAFIEYHCSNKSREMKGMVIFGCVNEGDDYKLYFCRVLTFM